MIIVSSSNISPMSKRQVSTEDPPIHSMSMNYCDLFAPSTQIFRAWFCLKIGYTRILWLIMIIFIDITWPCHNGHWGRDTLFPHRPIGDPGLTTWGSVGPGLFVHFWDCDSDTWILAGGDSVSSDGGTAHSCAPKRAPTEMPKPNRGTRNFSGKQKLKDRITPQVNLFQ